MDAIMPMEPRGSPAGRKKMALGFNPLFHKKGVMIMSDYEILAIVRLIVTLAFSVHNGTHK